MFAKIISFVATEKCKATGDWRVFEFMNGTPKRGQESARSVNYRQEIPLCKSLACKGYSRKKKETSLILKKQIHYLSLEEWSLNCIAFACVPKERGIS